MSKSVILLLALVTGPLSASDRLILGGSSGCENLSGVNAFREVNFAQVQSILNNNCGSCHIDGGSSGGLNMDPPGSYGNLLSPPSPTLPRVLPGNAVGSTLFWKVNCDSPAVGSRMPLGGTPLSLAQQRYFFDWIELGAPIQRSGFEDR
jgi:hypothetical protein